MRSMTWVLLLALAVAVPVAAQQTTLTPQDYLDIQQLVSKYAYAIDECTNKGYDYADLYVADGAFLTSRSGKILNRFEGRERLAEAARGGMPDCKDVPWAGIVHMLVNHVIEPAPGGATGKVYLIAIGLDGEPGKVEAQGRYEDVYVKTAERLALQVANARACGRPARGLARIPAEPSEIAKQTAILSTMSKMLDIDATAPAGCVKNL